MVESGGAYINRSLKSYTHLLRLYLQHLSPEEFLAHLDLAIETLDDVVHRLQFEKQNKPLKILGIKITNKVIGRVYVVIASVLFAVIQ